MAEEYQPTRIEILSEIWNGVRRCGKSLKDFGKYARKQGELMLTIPYIIPTAVRNIRNAKSDGDLSKYSLAKNIGGITGVIGGLVADIGQVVGYGYAVKEDHPEFLLIPVATNVASGVYEIGRKMYANARERVLEKHKPKGLEATLETAQSTQE
jgi:hypothetical protein